jgi:hypothetical protein
MVQVFAMPEIPLRQDIPVRYFRQATALPLLLPPPPQSSHNKMVSKPPPKALQKIFIIARDKRLIVLLHR